MNRQKKTRKKATAKNPIIFNFIVFLFPFVILFAFEGILRLANYGDNLDLFVKNDTEGYEKFMLVNPIIGKKYFQKFEYTSPPNDIFYAEKPANTFRIFVMGSSTVYGFPFERNLMFSRILNKQLIDKYPDKKIEVVNTAITAINSYTLYDYVDEILDYQPDAVLIYAGHNEFYGAFGIGSNETMGKSQLLTRMHISLMNLRMYQMVRNIISGIAGNLAKNDNVVHGTLMKRIVNDADILLNSDDYQSTMKIYRKNMEDILIKFKENDVPVFLSELVSNVSDIVPFNSVANDSLSMAIDVYNEAKNEVLLGNYGEAEKLFYQAKDLDGIRFRASEDINDIVDDLTDENLAVKVPMLDWFKENAENRLIGNNLMTEHVHPNIDGVFLMANAFYSKIKDSGILGVGDENITYDFEYYKKNWGFTILDSLIAVHRVNNLKGFWPFVKTVEKEYNYLQIYQPKSSADSIVISVLRSSDQMLGEARLMLARNYEKLGKFDLAYKEYEALLRTNPYIAINYRDAANCLIQLGDLPLALKYYLKSLEYENSFVALFRIGEIFLMKGDYEKSIAYFRQSFEIAPNDKKVNVLGRTYIAYTYLNKPAEAKAVADELKRVNPSANLNVQPKKYLYNQYVPYQTRLQVSKARELVAEDKFEDAIEILEESLKVYDSHIAKRLMGEIFLKEQELDEALNYYTKVYDEFRFDPMFLHDLVLINLGKNNIQKAQGYVKEIKQVDPDYADLSKLMLIVPS